MIINEILEKSMKHSIESIKIALAVKAARCVLDMSVKEVGAYCSVAGTTVSKWEAGELQLKMVTFMRLTKLFGENGVHIDICDNSIAIRVDDEGLEKRAKYLQQKSMLRKGETIESDPDSDKYTLVPKVYLRRSKSRT
jgi:predicted transcriptional regulator